MAGILKSSVRTRIPLVPLHELVLTRCLNVWKEEALVNAETGNSYTYEQLCDAIQAVASGLARRGIKKGDVFGFFAPNSNEYALTFLACLSAGGVFSGINSTYTDYELGHQLSDSQAKVLVTTSTSHPTFMKYKTTDGSKSAVQMVITLDKRLPDCVFIGDLLKDNGDAYPWDITFNVREDLGAIMYSSGTTGLPKGVMLTHYALVANVIMLSLPGNIPAYTTGERIVSLGFLPMFHMYGLLVMMAAFYFGGKLVTIQGFKPDIFLGAIDKHKVTQLYVVPPVAVFLAKSPLVRKFNLRSIKQVLSGAAPLSKDVEQEFLTRFHVDAMYQGYGMTELTAAVSVVPFGRPKAGSSGILAPNIDCKIIELGTGRTLAVGEEGEICIQSPSIMKGYLNRPEATRDAIDKEGWMHTGDVGYYDKDGYLFITGRIKELIKHKGFQVAPAEVEGLLMSHPGVGDAAVVGVPDPSAGELPRAFIVRKKSTTPVSAQEVIAFVQARLSRHKWLTGGVQFVSSIPKTASGKIIRRDVKKLLTQSKL